MDAFVSHAILWVISSPSGAGKTTLCRALLQQDPRIAMSVSVTTRQPRSGEVPHQDYHFISSDQFASMVQAGALLEHATVFNASYGTPREPVEQQLRTGGEMLFDIDWQGARSVATAFPAHTVRIFIVPPSIATLEARLRQRGKDSEATILQRMQEARNEISHWKEYDYVLVNDALDEAFSALCAIVTAERHRAARRKLADLEG